MCLTCTRVLDLDNNLDKHGCRRAAFEEKTRQVSICICGWDFYGWLWMVLRDVVVGTDSIDEKSSRMVQENICNNKSLLRAKKKREGDAVADER